jgi:hypothetical protein
MSQLVAITTMLAPVTSTSVPATSAATTIAFIIYDP